MCAQKSALIDAGPRNRYHFLRRPKSISRPRLVSKPRVNDSSGIMGKLESNVPEQVTQRSLTFALSRNVAHQ
jgi:hypothetical protein